MSSQCSRVWLKYMFEHEWQSMSKKCYLVSNNFLQPLFQVLCIKLTIFFSKIHNHSKTWKAHPHSLKKVKLSRRKIQLAIYFKQQTHFLLIPKRQNNSNHLFPHYIKTKQKNKPQDVPAHKQHSHLGPLEGDPQFWY